MTSPRPSQRSSGSSEGDSPSLESRIDLYRVAVDEYRFQVDLNWRRTQYYLAFNVALITIATSLGGGRTAVDRLLPCGLYVLAAVSAVLCLVSVRTQHQYYRSARDRMTQSADDLDLGTLAVRTTPGAGSTRGRVVSVTTLTTCILGLLAVLDVVGLLSTAGR